MKADPDAPTGTSKTDGLLSYTPAAPEEPAPCRKTDGLFSCTRGSPPLHLRYRVLLI